MYMELLLDERNEKTHTIELNISSKIGQLIVYFVCCNIKLDVVRTILE